MDKTVTHSKKRTLNMKSYNIEKFLHMFQPLPFGASTLAYSGAAKFSLAQTSHAQNYLSESLATLEDLCSQITLKIHHILLTCQEILEMAMAIPSIVIGDKSIDMREALGNFPILLRLATLLDVYYENPVTVTQSMIRKDCDQLAADL
jgi:hypothetical protein|tara:strand:+ start:85 stop:528 length:444 start_codon:yes stop_codon:yes gene_type:complete